MKNTGSQKRDKRLDTYIRVGGRKHSDQAGQKSFAASAHKAIPRIVKVHKAWMVMLIKQRVVEAERGKKVLTALAAMDKAAIDEMIETYDPHFSKVILQLERYLTDKAGPIASDINIGRTLPPPLYRMRMRNKMLELIDATLPFRGALLKKASKHTRAVMPGYTHLSHAQPMTFGHYLIGLYDAIDRASRRAEEAYASTNLSDMGCGALAGTSFNIDRQLPAELLGFDGIIEHSNDCVAATDHAVDTVAALTNLAIPLSRVANELDTWTCFEVNMVEITDALGSTSSMMPQKKSACVFEHVRSALAVVMGCYSDIVCRAHNTSYGDVIEVEAISNRTHSAIDTVVSALRRLEKAIETLIIKEDIMLRYAQEGFSTVSELAAVLYREAGIPLRVGYAVVAAVVRRVWEAGRAASDITTEMLDEAAIEITGSPAGLSSESLAAALDAVKFVEAHKSQGGVAPSEVERMILVREEKLEETRARHRERIQRLEEADGMLDAAVADILDGK